MSSLSPKTEQELRSFLCEHFELLELKHLARGILAQDPALIHSLPLDAPPSAVALVDAFIGVLHRHGLLDDEFFRALCAARPRNRDEIHRIWKSALRGVDRPSKKRDVNARIRICLEIEIEGLSATVLGKLLAALYAIVHVTQLVIESVTKGSSILVVCGDRRAIKQLQTAFAENYPDNLAGYRLLLMEFVPDEFLDENPPRLASLEPYALDDISPEEQVNIARILAALPISDTDKRRYIEDIMGQLMLLPEERDLVRSDFSQPIDRSALILSLRRAARAFLFYHAVLMMSSDDELTAGERNILLELAAELGFQEEATATYIGDLRGRVDFLYGDKTG